MRKSIQVVWHSLKMALNEVKNNRTRSFLSLFGITIGIFCIIGVLATVQSFQKDVESGIQKLGNNTIYVQKWPWGGGNDFPWWKYMKRPDPRYEELSPIKTRSSYAGAVAFILAGNGSIEYKDDLLTSVNWYGATEDFSAIQEIEIEFGRYINGTEFANGNPTVVMGHENALKLFGSPERAVGKTITLAKRNAQIVGVVKKQGASLVGGWDLDNIIIVPFQFARQVIDIRRSDKFLLVKGKDGVNVDDLKGELQGIMRSVRKLRPAEEDNFALNDVNANRDQLNTFFGSVNLGGGIIGGFSLIVGLFGIANIMFVTVRERTSQIGLKKAVGAKKSYIMTEFLLESSFLCLFGGLIGLFLVYLITLALNAVLPFKVFVSMGTIITGLTISIVVGLLAGIIPAYTAARMDPVVAIRSK